MPKHLQVHFLHIRRWKRLCEEHVTGRQRFENHKFSLARNPLTRSTQFVSRDCRGVGVDNRGNYNSCGKHAHAGAHSHTHMNTHTHARTNTRARHHCRTFGLCGKLVSSSELHCKLLQSSLSSVLRVHGRTPWDNFLSA